jgi:AraC-like DNA-binding protein
MNDILAYINRSITDSLSIQSLSERFFISPSYLCRLFKQHMGTTVVKYVTAQRIALAKSILESGCSVSDAYERSGFTDYSSFYKAFKKAVGISPKKYAGHI